MIDITKFSDEGLAHLKIFIVKNIERSELGSYYLFTTDPKKKAEIFAWCYRILNNVMNLLQEGEIKTMLEKELNAHKETFMAIVEITNKLNTTGFNQHAKLRRLEVHVERKEVDDFIDVFSVLSEKSVQYDLSRKRHFILSGVSGEAYNKVFKKAADDDDSYSEV